MLHQHHVACNCRQNEPIGSAGCICVIIPKRELLELQERQQIQAPMPHMFKIQVFRPPTDINSCGINNSSWDNTNWGSDDLLEAIQTATAHFEKTGNACRILTQLFQVGEEVHNLY